MVLVYALRGGSYDIVVFEEHGLVIWWIVVVGVALGLLPRARPSRGALVLLGAIAGYAAWIALSLSWTTSSERTFEELARTLDYLGLTVLAACVLDRGTWRPAAAGLGFGALLVCVMAVGSRLAPSVFGVDHVDAALHTSRLSYPFGYWNAMAAWGAMSMAIGLAWSAHDTGRLSRAVALALVPVAGLMTYLTSSRAGVGGTALALIAVIASSRNRFAALAHAIVAAAGTTLAIVAVRHAFQIAHATGTRGAGGVFGALIFAAAACATVAILTGVVRTDGLRLPRRVFRPLATVCTLAAVVAAAAVGPRLVTKSWDSFTRTTPVSSADPAARIQSLSGSRYPVWKTAVKAFSSHPVNGTGAGTFEFSWNALGSNGEFVRDAHNLWLQNMAELGVPGLLLIVAVALATIGLAVRTRRRVRRSASAGAAAAFMCAFVVYLAHATVDWMWQSTAVTVLALAGVATVGARLSGGRPRLPVYTRGALVLAAVVAGVIQIPGLVSTAEIRRSQATSRSGNAGLALAWANDAVNAEPWSASAYEQRGLIYESADELARAEQDLTSAVSREPTNYVHWLVLSRIETERGAFVTAVHDYRRARALRPHAVVFALAPYFGTRPIR